MPLSQIVKSSSSREISVKTTPNSTGFRRVEVTSPHNHSEMKYDSHREQEVYSVQLESENSQQELKNRGAMLCKKQITSFLPDPSRLKSLILCGRVKIKTKQRVYQVNNEESIRENYGRLSWKDKESKEEVLKRYKQAILQVSLVKIA